MLTSSLPFVFDEDSNLITGGAGFVGSTLAFAFKREDSSHRVIVVDNLKRRGSEINLRLLKQEGIEFFHGDIRNPQDLEDLDDEFDLFVEASAEPSVQAGIHSSPHYGLANQPHRYSKLPGVREKKGWKLHISLHLKSLLDSPAKADQS